MAEPIDVRIVAEPIAVSVELGAEMINVSPSVLRAHIDAGRLPIVKFPSTKRVNEQSRRVLILVDDLKAFAVRYRVAEAER